MCCTEVFPSKGCPFLLTTLSSCSLLKNLPIIPLSQRESFHSSTEYGSHDSLAKASTNSGFKLGQSDFLFSEFETETKKL